MWLLFLDLSTQTAGGVGNVAGEMMNTSYVGNILIALVFVVIILIYGFLLDPHNMLINLFSLYIGFVVVEFFPFEQWGIFGGTTWLGQLIFFIATVVVTAIILSLTHLFKIVYTRNFLARWWQAVSGGLLHGGLLVSILLSFLPAKFLTQFSPWMLNIFTSGKGHFWWTVLPILGLLFMRNKIRAGRPPAY